MQKLKWLYKWNLIWKIKVISYIFKAYKQNHTPKIEVKHGSKIIKQTCKERCVWNNEMVEYRSECYKDEKSMTFFTFV